MKKIFFTIPCIIGIISFANATDDINSYVSNIVRHGVTHKMLVYNYWSGEYPKPVIYVKATMNAWAKINGYLSLRNLKSRKVCTIKPGIYHPWSKDRISLIDYYSVVPQVNYLVLKNNILDEQRIRRGDTLNNEIYIAEGSCNYKLNNRKNITTTCVENFIEGSIKNSREFKQIKTPSHPSEQWLYLKCREGYNVFVRDKDLLKQPNVERGKIVGYGKVSRVKSRNLKYGKEFATYSNARFGFSIRYPNDLFTNKSFSDNGDGIILRSSDNQVELRAYGSLYGNNIKSNYKEEIEWIKDDGGKVTYKVLRKTWYVLSGYKAGGRKIFYQKTYFKAGKSRSFRLEYPTRDKRKYDSLISKISKNFKIK